MIVVFNNSCYAAMRRLHLSFYPDDDAAKSGIFHGVNIPGSDYQELVTPFGGHGERVEDPKHLAGALRTAWPRSPRAKWRYWAWRCLGKRQAKTEKD